MLDLATIRAMSQERAAESAEGGLEPYRPYNAEEIESYPPFPFPNIGDYRPNGWKLIDRLFCDSSGLGDDDEPALSVSQLIAKLKENLPKSYGYAIIEEGQFQLYLGVFKEEKSE